MTEATNEKNQFSAHRLINNGLTVIAIVLAIYISLGPLLPQLSWRFKSHPSTAVLNKLVEAIHQRPIPMDNTLTIPRLEMQEVIHTGNSLTELNKGAWLIPTSSHPDKNSNTVIVGHRFTYAGPAVFYYLDKVQLRDQIILTWDHKEYTYDVSQIKEVPSTEIGVEGPTDEAQLTLYTCTPLWTAKNRLVIIAHLEKVRS
jgi:LPXTG-site transpeptidase (sortase) family protein